MDKIDRTNRSNRNFLNQSSNDKQEISSKVIGVLKYNNAIRENLLNRNIGKYKLINLSEGIGYIPNIYASEFSKPLSLGEEGLLGYTHNRDDNSDYSIKKLYDIDDDFSYYYFNSLRNNYKRWNGNFRNYVDYINTILSYPLHAQTIIDSYLSYKDIHQYVKNSRISILPKPYNSLSGEIVTNPSYFNYGVDTRIGVITNSNYARLLNKSAIINTIRNTNHITPSAYSNIGLKTNTINDLNSLFRIDEKTGRLAYDLYNRDVLSMDNVYKSFNIKPHKNLHQENILGERTTLILNNFINGFGINGEELKLNNSKKFYTPINQYDWSDITTGTTYNKEYIDETDDYVENSLLSKTHEDAKNYNFKTLLSKYNNSTETKTLTQTAIDKIYGLSHGRNLTKKEPNGNNPYCRVWKKNNQYDSVDKLIGSASLDARKGSLEKLETRIRPSGSGNRLINNSVITNEGFVKITPYYDNGKIENIKNCMFSIENLAWKGYTEDLSPEQIGSYGGRIMWFPPYGINFNEVINTNWNPNEFIGRGEKIYTYTNTERGGTLSFMLLIDYPSILDIWKKNNYSNNDDVEKSEQDVLRFFAGCTDLEPSKPDNNNNTNVVNFDPNTLNNIVDGNNKKDIVYVFYPNYFSGIDILDDGDYCDYLIDDYDTKECWYDTGGTPYFCYKVDNKYTEENTVLYHESNYNELNPLFLNSKHDNLNGLNATMTFEELVKKIKGTGFKNVKEVVIQSSASSHGTDLINDVLVNNRNKRILKFLQNSFKNTNVHINEENPSKITNVDKIDLKNISGDSAKKSRFSRIEIIYNDSTIENTNKNSSKENVNNTIVNTKQQSTDNTIQTSLMKKGEYEYFNKLKDNDDFTYKRIIDKIKYFTPAFHSITPEGFNERLSFLHQCTRQGPTCALSDGNIKGRAGNLAFGRPPICILRLGDFYYTKIIIESVTINYENQLWDMNHSGIGMQPMFANISLNFKFLGGSDLNGPVTRLQNAVSFNYYANQSIYDSRAYIPTPPSI